MAINIFPPTKRSNNSLQLSFFSRLFYLQTFPGLMPYKRPAPDNKGYQVYQPSAAAYQQLMQLQSQQPFVPVSCEYSLCNQTHALADTSIYPNTSTATLNANNNLHHHLNLYNQTISINACNNINPNLINNNNNNTLSSSNNNNNNDYNNFNNSTFFADDAQINTIYTPTAQQNSISQSSPSKVTSSNNIEHNTLTKIAVAANAVAAAATSPDDGDSENALTVQNAKIANANGTDDALLVSSATNIQTGVETNNNNVDESVVNNSKSINEKATENGNDLLASFQNNHADDATQTSSIQSAIDENNLNANSFNSATSSSPAASLAAIYTTSSITNNNNSILSRKNSLTTPNQHLINSSKAPTSYTNTQPSGKVDTVPDYLSASSLNNHPQAALLSAMLYNQPYQQLALQQNLYSDPAQLAKEMAQKNYANALKFAVAQQTPSVAGKSPLTAMPYSGVTLSANSNAMFTQQPGTSASRLSTPMNPSARSPYMPTLSRPMQNPFQQFIRPQLPMSYQTATNPYYAAAAAHQQFLSQQNYLYSAGLTSPMTSQQLTATSVASPTPSPYASSSYPYALSQAQAMSAQGLPASMLQVPQITSQPSQTGSTSSVVLNPYKKMKTS